jgi:hypothetical protein
MSIKTKSALILAATLLLGMVLGGLVNARMVDSRVEQIGHLRTDRGFVRHFDTAIEPVDDEQEARIREILDRNAARMTDHMRRSRAEARAIMGSMREELSLILTDEQMAQLQERRPRLREGYERRGPQGDRRGPRGRGSLPDDV